MGPKKDNDSGKVKRKNTNIMIDVKKEIIAKHENGVRVSDLATQFGMAKSTICTILKNKETIKKADVARGVTVFSKQRSQTIEEVEKLLLIWINDNMLTGNSVSEGMICEKARRLHDDLVKKYPGTSSDTDVFKASRGWFERFKKRSGIHGVVRHGEAASANQKAAEEFVQVFNCDEISQFSKKMPRMTYIIQEETALAGQKPVKDRHSLLHCNSLPYRQKKGLKRDETAPPPTSTVLLPLCDDAEPSATPKFLSTAQGSASSDDADSSTTPKFLSTGQASRRETSNVTDFFDRLGEPSTSQLEHCDIKIEEHDVLSETEDSNSNQIEGADFTTDPLKAAEDDEELFGETDDPDISNEAQHLLPETSAKARRKRTKTYNKFYCRLCLKEAHKQTMLPLGELDLYYPGKSQSFKDSKMKTICEVQQMLQLCLPSFESLTFNPVICSSCIVRLKPYYEFASKCMKNQELIKDYIEIRATTEKVVDINEMMESKFISKKKSEALRKKAVVTKKSIPGVSKHVGDSTLNTLQQQRYNQIKTYSRRPAVGQKRTIQHADNEPTLKKEKIQDTAHENLEDLFTESMKGVTVKEEIDDCSLLSVDENIDTYSSTKIDPDYIDRPQFIKPERNDEVEDLEMTDETPIKTEAQSTIYHTVKDHEVENESSNPNRIIYPLKRVLKNYSPLNEPN